MNYVNNYYYNILDFMAHNVSGCMRRCQPPIKQPVGLWGLAMWVKEAWEWA